MALEGTLESFGIAEIFQLIATQAKTGELEIIKGESVTRIRFVKGQVLDAYPGEDDPSLYIGNMLIRAGLVTKTQLEYALGQQKRSLRKLGDILIRMGTLRTSEFQQMLALQRREMAYNLLRLKSGKYKFNQIDIKFEEGVDTLLNVDALLMEGSRQIDEWPAALKRIPSEGRVYKRNPDIQPMRELSEEEMIVYGLVDGTYTVREVVDRSRLGEFPAWDAMASLYDEGLITPVEVKKRRSVKPPRIIGVPKTSPHYTDALVGIMFTALAVAVLVFPNVLQTSPPLKATTALELAGADMNLQKSRILSWNNAEPLVPPLPGGDSISARGMSGEGEAEKAEEPETEGEQGVR